jgi:hypothetical protein
MNKILLLLAFAAFTSCQEEEIEPNAPQCECYEIHETLEPIQVNGQVTLGWVLDYETTPLPMDCASATEYYNSSNTARWKRICQ